MKMNTLNIMVTTNNNESNIKEQIIQSQEQEQTNTGNTAVTTLYKSLLFDKLIDIKQKTEDLMAEYDRAIKHLENIVVLTEEQQFELGNFSYAPYVNALRFSEQVTKDLKNEGK